MESLQQKNEKFKKTKGWNKTIFEDAIEKFPDLIERGQYITQIEHLLRFYPRNQLYIGIAEHIRQDTNGEYNKIHDFLGVNRLEHQKYELISVGTYPAPISSETRAGLLELYQPNNERLFKFLGYRIEEWEK